MVKLTATNKGTLFSATKTNNDVKKKINKPLKMNYIKKWFL